MKCGILVGMEQNEYMSKINWSVFNNDPENNCYCRCGAIFRSHAKFVGVLGKMVARKPCPACGKNDDMQRVSSDPESFIIKGR